MSMDRKFGGIAPQVVGWKERNQKRIDELRTSLAVLPELLTPTQVAEILRIDEKEVYRLTHTKELEGQFVARALRIKKESIFTLLGSPGIAPQ